jgi:hypothetical protein
MRVADYDRMDKTNQNRYLSLLIEGMQRLLVSHGRTADATKVKQLFAGDGRNQFEDNLVKMRTANTDRIQVEDVLCVTVRWNGILKVPGAFYEIGRSFEPSS